jgi:hypothetical protein
MPWSDCILLFSTNKEKRFDSSGWYQRGAFSYVRLSSRLQWLCSASRRRNIFGTSENSSSFSANIPSDDQVPSDIRTSTKPGSGSSIGIGNNSRLQSEAQRLQRHLAKTLSSNWCAAAFFFELSL